MDRITNVAMVCASTLDGVVMVDSTARTNQMRLIVSRAEQVSLNAPLDLACLQTCAAMVNRIVRTGRMRWIASRLDQAKAFCTL